MREFLETKAFGERVNLDDPQMIKAISSSIAQYVTVKNFVQTVRALVLEELQPSLVNQGRLLSETPPIPWHRGTLEASKTVFNLVAMENEFERKFARFLQDAPDVSAFAKLPERFDLTIEYTDSAANLRYYEPDFVVVMTEGQHICWKPKGARTSMSGIRTARLRYGARMRRFLPGRNGATSRCRRESSNVFNPMSSRT